jgi:DNA-binding beta-propeller fold protein YncE
MILKSYLSISRAVSRPWRGRALALPGLVLALEACAPSSAIVVEYLDFEGDAYPSRRAPLPSARAGLALVTDSLGDTVSLVDLDAGELAFTYPVGRDPVAIDGPHHVAVDEARGHVFIGLSYPDVGALGPHAGHGTSLRSGFAQRLSLDDLSLLGQERVELNPGDLVASADGSRVVVSHFDLVRATTSGGDLEKARASLAVLDGAALGEVGGPALVPTCIAPHGMALAGESGSRVYVACYGEDSVAVVDLDALEVLERLPMGPSATTFTPSYGPYATALAPAGDWLAVSNLESRDVRLLELASGEVDATRVMSTLGIPYFPAYSVDGAQLFVPTQTPDALVAFELSTGDEVAYVPFAADECERPHQAVLRPNGELVLVCEGDHEGPGAIVVLDAGTLEIVRRVSVGVFPDALVELGLGGGS